MYFRSFCRCPSKQCFEAREICQSKCALFYLGGVEADAWSTFLPWDWMVDINSQCFQVMPTVREERSMMTTVSTTRRRRYGG